MFKVVCLQKFFLSILKFLIMIRQILLKKIWLKKKEVVELPFIEQQVFLIAILWNAIIIQE